MRVAFLLLALAASLPAQTRSILIDTDVGSDDLMAISYLLANPKIQIEAISILFAMHNFGRRMTAFRFEIE